MNTILLHNSEIHDTNSVTLSDYRFHHISSVISPEIGDELSIGIINTSLGTAKVSALSDTEITLTITNMEKANPAPLPAKLICALPRPKMFRRILHMAVVSGVKEVHFIKTWRVDKSYWSSPFLSDTSCKKIILEALSQTGDTTLPQISFHKQFKPFVEDILPTIIDKTMPILFHPTSEKRFNCTDKENYTLIIGPEGGFIPYEVELLAEAGCQGASMGPRILQVEQAVSAILGHILLTIA